MVNVNQQLLPERAVKPEVAHTKAKEP